MPEQSPFVALFALVAGLPYVGTFAALAPLIVCLAAFIAPALPPPREATGLAYTLFYRLVNVLAQNYGHARNAADRPLASWPFAIIVTFAVAGCNPASQQALAVACKVDAAAQPVLVTLAPALSAELAPIAQLDAALVHPIVTAACAGIAGTPTAVQPKS